MLSSNPISKQKDLITYYHSRSEHYDDRDISERVNDVRSLRVICHDLFQDQDVLELACGTGIWTQHISCVARSVLATDINPAMLRIARHRLQDRDNVRFMHLDAYDLGPVTCECTAGFAGWWLSHVDKSRMRNFLTDFHAKLAPRALVVFMDDTPEVNDRISFTDDFDNTYTIRQLRDDSTYEIIKNFYTEEQLKAIVTPFGCNINVFWFSYHWLLSYNVK